MLEHAEVDRLIGIAAWVSVGVWLCFLGLVLVITQPEQWVSLSGVERQAPILAVAVLSTSLVLLCLPWIVWDTTTAGSGTTNEDVLMGQQSDGARFRYRRCRRPSGVIFAAVVVMVMAILTNVLLAFAPTAVVVDPVLGTRVFLLRWCEWIPLTGLMTFMSDVVDADDSAFEQQQVRGRATSGGFLLRLLQPPVRNSMSQFCSALCGIIFPFCPNTSTWIVTQIFSLSFFLTIFPLVKAKRQRYLSQPKGVSLLDKENFDRRYFSYHLMKLCSWIWTFLVVMYYLHAFIYFYQSSDYPWVHASSAMVVDTVFDVLAKCVYLKVIVAVHHDVFDPDARARAQLGELRSLMQLLWDTTTDSILISMNRGEETSSVLSPSYRSLVGSLKSGNVHQQDNASGILLRTSKIPSGNNSELPKVLDAKYIDSSHISSATPIDKLTVGRIDPDSKEVQLAAQIIHSCWKRLEESHDGSLLVLHKFDLPNGEISFSEIKVSQKSPGSFVAMIRDVTERYKRFEAEKRAHAEALARQKDAQTVNRFTRHEIKNGLLSGIELCAGLQKALDLVLVGCEKDADLKLQMTNLSGMIEHLDASLHEILDTVLAEAMARDVIHECYVANPKKADLLEVLRSTCSGIGIEPRFPLHISPSEDMPKLLIDKQLVRFIHRNAVSNASKYGKPGGIIATNIHYQHVSDNPMLTLEVVNEPGPGHSRLLDMGEDAAKIVFEPGTRLHTDGKDDSANSLSAGDGAWIMQKCAKTMGGVCTISFEIDRTVLRLKWPVTPVVEITGSDETPPFHLPLNTWGLGIDDSAIQRKQLVRILANAGIHEGYRRVIGQSLEVLDSTMDLILKFLTDDPSSKGLILVDENLDYVDDCGARVIRSGSKMFEAILQRLPPDLSDRLLVLVRSANDSAEDVALYTKRTHGFFTKTATRKEDILDILEPAWKKRFGAQRRLSLGDLQTETRSCSSSLLQDDLRDVVNSVDKLVQRWSSGDVPWPHLWSALHSLKGDIMVSDHPKLRKAVDDIEAMRGTNAPEDFDMRWADIRQCTLEGIALMDDLTLE